MAKSWHKEGTMIPASWRTDSPIAKVPQFVSATPYCKCLSGLGLYELELTLDLMRILRSHRIAAAGSSS